MSLFRRISNALGVIINPATSDIQTDGSQVNQIVDPLIPARRWQMDTLQKLMPSISEPHHEVHEGDAHTVCTFNTSMASGNTIIIAFKTPNVTTWAHLVMGFVSKSQGHIDMIENPTWTTGSGIQLPIYNRNRNSLTTSTLLEDTTGVFTATNNFVLNPTGLVGGNIICSSYTFSGKQETTESNDVNERILKQNTQYAYRFTADAASNAAGILLDWYEHLNE